MVATHGKGWKLAPALVDLIAEVDETWPGRPTGSDGSIGDTAHSNRQSEHNPNDHGLVTAVDITKKSAAMMTRIRQAAVADDRVWYVIHDGSIWSRTHGFKKAPYQGSNPHRQHMHISLRQTADAAKDGPWGIADAPTPAALRPATEPEPETDRVLPVLLRDDRHELVRVLQRFLGVAPTTEHFGPATERAVRDYQRRQGLVVDGVVGPKTWARMVQALRLDGWRVK